MARGIVIRYLQTLIGAHAPQQVHVRHCSGSASAKDETPDADDDTVGHNQQRCILVVAHIYTTFTMIVR